MLSSKLAKLLLLSGGGSWRGNLGQGWRCTNLFLRVAIYRNKRGIVFVLRTSIFAQLVGIEVFLATSTVTFRSWCLGDWPKPVIFAGAIGMALCRFVIQVIAKHEGQWLTYRAGCWGPCLRFGCSLFTFGIVWGP
ncbi:hypothetical protein HOY82DRAFT_141161 [Tuber indicum]|nr:hypothetical protein HOY82DRAFT_141161 [Tuber indicum]